MLFQSHTLHRPEIRSYFFNLKPIFKYPNLPTACQINRRQFAWPIFFPWTKYFCPIKLPRTKLFQK